MLEDLKECLKACQERIEKIPLNQPFIPSPELWVEVVTAFKSVSKDKVQVISNTLVLTTPDGYFLTISAQEIPRCWAVQPYVIATRAYEAKIDELATKLGFTSRSSGRAKEDIFKKLADSSWETKLDQNDVTQIHDIVSNDLGLSDEEKSRFLRFISDKEWSGVAKSLERGDWRLAAIQSAGKWLAVASARRGELSDALTKSVKFESLMDEAINQPNIANPIATTLTKNITVGQNLIIYGAPGTGKSHKIDELVKGQSTFRTVFHPDTQNSDFFGCLKPQMDGDKISYVFAPGPFALALRASYLTPTEQHFLIIEEMNRAPAAAVFGELFQLLDRKDDGSGTYEVDFPTPESKAWFQSEVGATIEKICIPSNLSLLATMNSADQGVYPLDTAFRRRWEQEYLPLYEGTYPEGFINIVDGTDKLTS